MYNNNASFVEKLNGQIVRLTDINTHKTSSFVIASITESNHGNITLPRNYPNKKDYKKADDEHDFIIYSGEGFLRPYSSNGSVPFILKNIIVITYLECQQNFFIFDNPFKNNKSNPIVV